MLKYAFQFGRIDIFSIAEHNDFLLTSSNIKTSLLVEIPKITCMQPASLIHHHGSLLRPVVIAKHDILSFHTNFSILNIHPHTGHRFSYTTRHNIVGTSKCNYGSSFRHAKAFQHIQSKSTHTYSYFLIQGSSSAYTIGYVTSHFLANRGKDKTRKSTTF